MKILKIKLSYLRNESHHKLMQRLLELFAIYVAVADIVADLLAPFKLLVDLEDKLVDAKKVSDLTEEIADTDKRIDRCIVGINNTVTAALHHFDQNVVKAAKVLESLLGSFHGSIKKKAYEEQSVAVAVLLKELTTTYAPQVALLNMSDWVTELSAAHADFDRLFAERNLELAKRPKEKLIDVRRDLDKGYNEITDRIDAYAKLNGEQTCEMFVKEWNETIIYFRDHDHHHAKIDIKAAVVASIPDQQYSGIPVVMIPEVMYEGTRLVFAKDFSILYKNNDKPGTATLIVKGKGKYNGRKEVSFNIIGEIEIEENDTSKPASKKKKD
jgi:hypothetical protein